MAGRHALQFLRGEDLCGQTLGPFGVQQVFQVHSQSAPMAFFCDDSGGTARAVGDRAGNVCRPDGGPVFADGRAEVQTFQLLQCGTGADTAGEKLRLTLGDGALDGRWRFNGAALEIVADQLRGIEVRAQQHGIGQHMGQRPMGIEWGAESRQGGDWVHVWHFAGLDWRWVVVKGFGAREQASSPQRCSAPDVGRVS